MICNSPQDILKEIKKRMIQDDITMKELRIRTGKSQQSISQIFRVENPKLSTLFEICAALNLDIDFNLIEKSDTE